MSWKSFIKSFIPFIPFLPYKRWQVLGLNRSDFKPVNLDTERYVFRGATLEDDGDDIIEAFPANEFNYLVEQEERREEITRRFHQQSPCFVVREKGGNQLLGAVWMRPQQFGFLSRNQERSAKLDVEVRNLFVVPEKRSHGLAKQLLSFAIEHIFGTTDCKRIVSRVKEKKQRISSLLLHLKLNFSVLGTFTAQKVFGKIFSRFVRRNTNPFLDDFQRVPVIAQVWSSANSLGIARSLGRHKVPFYALTQARDVPVAWSRYVKKLVHISSKKNLAEVQERLLDILREIGPQSEKPIFTLNHESHFLAFEPLNDFLEEHFNVLTPIAKAAPLTSKNNQFPLAEQAGFRVMETIILRNTEDLERVENSFAFPVIVRPMSDRSREKTLWMKTALYDHIDAMRKHLNPLLENGEIELIAQEYVPGKDSDVVFFLASCDEFGEPRLWLAGRKIRQNPPGRGVMASGTVDPVPDPEFVEKSKRLCRLFGLRGNIGIECKQHSLTKEYVYIESSFRPEAFNSIGLAAGVDLVWDSYLTALNKPCGAVQPDKHKGSWVNAEFECAVMKTLRKQGDPDWRKVMVPLPRPIAYAFFTWDDPLPFFHSIGVLVARRVKRLFSKESQ